APREHDEHHEADRLLEDLELIARERAIPDAVRRHLHEVLEEGDAPTDDDDHRQGHVPEAEEAVPGERHERIRHHHQLGGGERVAISSSTHPRSSYHTRALTSTAAPHHPSQCRRGRNTPGASVAIGRIVTCGSATAPDTANSMPPSPPPVAL